MPSRIPVKPRPERSHVVRLRVMTDAERPLGLLEFILKPLVLSFRGLRLAQRSAVTLLQHPHVAFVEDPLDRRRRIVVNCTDRRVEFLLQ